MIGGAVAFVVESDDPKFRDGDAVEGMLGWQEYAVAPGRELRKIDLSLGPISTALGVLGTPGLTALFGLLDVCDPHRGETVVVSGAAGAVGMLVGQIAKIKGCRVVGVASSDVEISWLLDELGFDAASNDRSQRVGAAARGALPRRHRRLLRQRGRGPHRCRGATDERRARIAVCGQSSQDNLEQPEMGPRWLGELIVKQAKVQGFLVAGFAERFPEGFEQLARWLQQGKIKYREDIALGIEAAPQAFIGMLQEKNQGQQLVQLSGV